MKYKLIPKTHLADTIASAMYGREMEHFHYEFDVINFRYMIDNAPEGADLKGLVL